MKKEDALKIIKDEDLILYNWFNDHPLWPNEVGIMGVEDGWCVFCTSERASMEGDKLFQDESEALESFIKRLRAGNRLHKRYLMKREKT